MYGLPTGSDMLPFGNLTPIRQNAQAGKSAFNLYLNPLRRVTVNIGLIIRKYSITDCKAMYKCVTI